MAKTERKTAVVLVHGIGDQAPLATLRSFVRAIVGPPPDNSKFPAFWSKPDAVSGSFDLRRFQSVGRNSNGIRRPPIDFYEYYWAHRMEGNAFSHVLQWVENLLFRRPSRVPRPMLVWWALCWLALAFAGFVLLTWATPIRALVAGGALAAIIFVATSMAKSLVRDWAGDAARYFSTKPNNITVREEIRRGCVDLLQNLHRTGEYSRIIVVGHSLGSAIAFDALYHYWTIAREQHGKPSRPAKTALGKLEGILNGNTDIDAETLRPLQKEIWRELRANGVPWRITDFVTLGSPLTYYPFLTGLDDEEFDERRAQREFSVCPPVLDGKGISYWQRYGGKAGQQRSIPILHHAACFAATRWTNIYFPFRGLLKGDPVGGPLAPLFGCGIRDRPVVTRRWRGRLNHLHYWKADERDANSPDAPLAVLLDTLALSEGFKRLPVKSDEARSD